MFLFFDCCYDEGDNLIYVDDDASIAIKGITLLTLLNTTNVIYAISCKEV